MRGILLLISALLITAIIFVTYHFKKQDSAIKLTYVKAIYSMPVSYDPIKMNDGASLIFSELVYEGLLRFNDFYGVQGAIASSWETSTDGLVLTFKLNPNARFHDGSQVTADDVVFSLSRNVSKDSLVFKYYDVILGAKDYFTGKVNFVKGLTVIDESTVEIRLERPFPPIIYVLAGGSAKVLPKSQISNATFFQKPIGSGPFQVRQINDASIELVRFDQYAGEMPKLLNMTLLYEDQAKVMSDAITKKVHDLSAWPLSGKEEVFKYGQDISSPVADTWVLGINTRIAPFDKVEVRKLFQQSIDSEKFRQEFYPDAISAYGYLPPEFPGHVNTKAVAESLQNTTPPKIPITVYIPQGLEQGENMAKFFEDELRANGWNATSKIISWDEMMKGYSEKTLPLFLVSMIVDYPDVEFLLNNFESSNPDNFSGINDLIVDDLISKSRQIQDRQIRQEMHQKLAQRVNDLALTVNLFHSRAHYWIGKCVRGFTPNPLAVAYIDYRKVFWDKNCMENR